MQVVIVGQKWLGVEVLRLCQARGDTVVKVIAPDIHDRLHVAAREGNIPAETGGARLDAEVIPHDTDIILAAHAHTFISRPARELARFGALGYHPSLLPRHCGRDAVRWTIHMRDPIAGGTAYWLDDGADTGPIAAQDWCHVLPTDDAVTLWQRDLAPMGIRLIGQILKALDTGKIPASSQPKGPETWEPAFTQTPLSRA
jgi:methionyl-tRNA formyltransferase